MDSWRHKLSTLKIMYDETDLLDKVLFAALLCAIQPGQKEVRYRQLVDVKYTATTYLLSVYLKRLAQKCYISPLSDCLENGDMKFRIEDPCEEYIKTGLLDYLEVVKFDVKYYRQVYSVLLHQNMIDECMCFLNNELNNSKINVNSNNAPPHQIKNLLSSYSIQEVCTFLKLALNEVLNSHEQERCREMKEEYLLNLICRAALDISSRISAKTMSFEEYKREASYKSSAVSFVLTNTIAKMGQEYYQDNRLWTKFSTPVPLDLSSLFHDKSAFI